MTLVSWKDPFLWPTFSGLKSRDLPPFGKSLTGHDLKKLVVETTNWQFAVRFPQAEVSASTEKSDLDVGLQPKNLPTEVDVVDSWKFFPQAAIFEKTWNYEFDVFRSTTTIFLKKNMFGLSMKFFSL